MAIKTYRPYTPSRRAMTSRDYSGLSKVAPEKSLLVPMKHSGGRNNQGKITCRHIGGGNKRRYRIIDFRRRKDGIPATVKTIEYDPNRNANIALVCYADGEKAYIIHPAGLKVGDVIVSGPVTDIKVGNCLELVNIPDGTFIHNLELQPGKGAQMCRAAGTSAQKLGSEGRYVTVRLASGEVRKLLPTVRGSAMNPCDHPHGGGEGKCPVGRDAPRNPWGKRTQGVKTRRVKKNSTRLIVRRRTK